MEPVKRFVNNETLASQEPRHFASWDFPALPRLQPTSTSPSINRALDRRSRAIKSKTRRWRILLDAFLHQ